MFCLYWAVCEAASVSAGLLAGGRWGTVCMWYL